MCPMFSLLTGLTEMLITTDLILSLRPCEEWPRERVEEVVGDGQSLREFASNSNAPEIDRIRVLAGLMDREQYLLFRAAIAEAVLLRNRKDGREPDHRSWRAVRTLQAYARGEVDRGKLVEAADAAYASYVAAYASYASDYASYASYATASYAADATAASPADIADIAAHAADAATRYGITWQWLLKTAVEHVEASKLGPLTS